MSERFEIPPALWREYANQRRREVERARRYIETQIEFALESGQFVLAEYLEAARAEAERRQARHDEQGGRTQ